MTNDLILLSVIVVFTLINLSLTMRESDKHWGSTARLWNATSKLWGGHRDQWDAISKLWNALDKKEDRHALEKAHQTPNKGE